MNIAMSNNMRKYFDALDNKIKSAYEAAGKAREKGYDPSQDVEIPLARNLGERVEGLVSVMVPQIKGSGIVKRLEELEKEYGLLDWRAGLKIGLEAAQEKFCRFKNKQEAMETGVRVGLAYLTLGVVSSPLEGFVKLKIRKRQDGREYFALFYSGPIRSAGGTMAAVSVIIADYIRKNFGYDIYDPSENEVKRIVTELYDYHEKVTNLQYLPSEEEIEFLARSLPVQMDGDPSEKFEVSNYKDLPRVETNTIRNGVCLVIGEGIAQKAVKIWKQLEIWGKDFGLEHWNFLQNFVKLQKKAKARGVVENIGGVTPDNTFIKDVVGGRPVLTHPLRKGGFRLRYGRTRSSGLSSVSMHPATMVVLDGYIATGTQLKCERPGKSSAMSPCDYIEGPIVKLDNGDVMFLDTVEEARNYKNKIVEILFMGDMLVSYAEFYHRGHKLVPVGYCEEWWASEIKKMLGNISYNDKELEEVLKEPIKTRISCRKAVEISKKLGVALHPRYTYHWKDITKQEFLDLIDWVKDCSFDDGRMILALDRKNAKRVLELLGVPHKIADNEVVVIQDDYSMAFIESLGCHDKDMGGLSESAKIAVEDSQDVLEAVNKMSGIGIRDKSGTFIGARMGRPEKAKMRKLTGSPQILFPVGDEGGRMRSLNAALVKGKITAEFPIYNCKACGKETIFSVCESCNGKTGEAQGYRRQQIDINHYFKSAVKKLGINNLPELIKGVRGTSNESHIPENLMKGILRSMNKLYVNKDGTIRYDMTEMPLTHFKPGEIGTNVEKLRKLGYEKDIYGEELINEEQILEIKPQDIVLPSSKESLEEGADEVLFRASKFVDDLLTRMYGLNAFYNLKEKKDLVGELVVGIAPHISAAIVGRIIGFSNVQACYAHPLWHSAQRRDCDGDENCVILLMDALLNFSRKFFPAHRGATQDAPLVLISQLIPSEVDDMVFHMDVAWNYPIELYEAAMQYKDAKNVKIEQLITRLGTEGQYEGMGFTHHLSSINMGVNCSAYKTIPSMKDKVLGQMKIAEKIRAVDQADVARLIIERHFIRDIRGNLRKFTMQQFRCVDCNEKYRRVPLTARCLKCNGNLMFTIAEGGVIKYLEPSLELANKYGLPAYLKQVLELTKRRIESVFGKDNDRQTSLNKWFA